MKLGDAEVVCRAMSPGDRNFIISTWLRSGRDLTRMKKDDYFKFTRPQVEADIEHGDVIVACDESSPGTICGWACYRDGVVRWAYTAYQLRGNGIFGLLRSSYSENR